MPGGDGGPRRIPTTREAIPRSSNDAHAGRAISTSPATLSSSTDIPEPAAPRTRGPRRATDSSAARHARQSLDPSVVDRCAVRHALALLQLALPLLEPQL